ncbi:hypothetical protein Vadar_018190 [Vaccinium darrowii]|uniref:Uncharacterized protein n=1 Tax=Vaccinium darrowii TaxID=229202 RepID=A0ACB7ZME8_9ERIC|nr:hypothetical protein Vadar_018190 [Vaccinium darrowii]
MCEKMEGIEVILRRFGDEQSTLLDRFERHSFEVQLNQAILLGRSLSEPTVPRTRTQAPLPPPPLPVLVALPSQVQQGRRRGSGFKKVLKRLLNPILRRKSGRKEVVSNPKDPMLWKAFSRSMRV